MTRSIEAIQADLATQKRGLVSQTARQVRARGQLKAPLRDKEGRQVFSFLSNINKRQRAEINSAGNQITRIRKRIINFENELRQHQTQVQTVTSQNLIGSTIGSASFTPPEMIQTTAINLQDRSIIRIDTSKSDL